MQHHIPFQHNSRDTMRTEQRVIEWFLAGSFFFKYLFGKVNEVAEIVDPAARYQVISLCQVKAADQVFQQAWVDLMIVHETDRLSFATVPQSFFNALDDT